MSRKSTMSAAMEKAIELVKQATDADHRKKYDEAFPLYDQSIENFLRALKYEALGEQSRERIRSKCAQYQERAEQLRKYLEKKATISAASYMHVVVADVVQKPNIHWDDIAGLHTAKKVLMETAILPKKFPHLFKAECRKPCRRILLYGPSGTGKSHLAKAVATETDSTLLISSSADLVSKSFGKCEKLVKQLFELADNNNPAIIYIDQVDYFCTPQASDMLGEDQLIDFKSKFLAQMRAMDDGIMVIGTTNFPWRLDAVFHKMFEKKIHIPLPDKNARLQMFKIHNRTIKTTLNDGDYHTLAAKTEGYSGADIDKLVREAVMVPIRKVQAATHFKITSGPSPNNPTVHRDDLLTPCSPGDKEATEMNWRNVPSDRLLEPPVTIEDYIRAISKTQPSVDRADLVKFQEWIKDFGQES